MSESIIDQAIKIREIMVATKNHSDALPEEVSNPLKLVLTSIPQPGELYREKTTYILGDSVTGSDGIEYVYILDKARKGKDPTLPENIGVYWKVKPVSPEYQEWDSYPELFEFSKNYITSHNSLLWICDKQHLKSVLYEPKEGSSRWSIYTSP